MSLRRHCHGWRDATEHMRCECRRCEIVICPPTALRYIHRMTTKTPCSRLTEADLPMQTIPAQSARSVARANAREFAALASELLGAGRAIRFRAQGRSMLPFVRDGDLLTVLPCPSKAFRVGDVAFYRGKTGQTLAHRVLAMRTEDGRLTFYLRGDALKGRADRVEAERILGKVTRIRRGTRTLLLDTPLQRRLGAGWAAWQSVHATLRIRLGRLRRRLTGRA